ncbi:MULTISPECIES: ABC transporter permease [unclassified Clostridium]|uniref:ABC transporter permease n=1 Tax=unclassified Clostridium TaxID=2614128 RepID=UPI0025B8D49C|nr:MULTISPECIES: ABC transporter permease [unclassified Clostridium]
MKILNIAFKDLLINAKDKGALGTIILMPVVLIFVLGMSLSTMFNEDKLIMKPFDVVVVDKDKEEYGKDFKEFFKSKDMETIVNIKELDENIARNKVKNGDIPVLIIVPEQYSKSIREGKETNIEIYTDPGSPLSSKIIESLVKSYTGISSSIQGAIDAADKVLKDYNMNGYMIAPDLEKVIESNKIEFKESSFKSGNGLSAIQYYSAAMIAMFILFVGMIGTSSIIEERNRKTLLRLMSSSVSKGTIVTGKFLGLFAIGTLDVFILILFTKFAFKVSWGNSILGLIILSASMIFASCGFAMLLATMFKTSKAVNSINPALIMIMSFLGGNMYPLFLMPSTLQAVSKITPNNWALRGYLSLMLNNGASSIFLPSIILFIMGMVFLTLGISRLKLD